MNRVYAISPALTLRTSPVAITFLDAVCKTYGEYGSLSMLHSAGALRSEEPDRWDIVIVFNRSDQAYEGPVVQFLEKAMNAGSTILPVAVGKEERNPPTVVAKAQSFDILEQLRQRTLTEAQVATIATVFARQILATSRPTLTVEPMHLFLSHRRFDGEEVAESFHRALITTTQKAFRDLYDVRVGEDAQEIIDANLRLSDAVLFLDTPRAGESEWIAKELEAALSLQLPIVWIRLGPDTGRTPLRVVPCGSPHFSFPLLNPATDSVNAQDVEKIVHTAFNIHHRDYVDRMFDDMARLKQVAHEQAIAFEVLDPRRMIYRLTLPRRAGRYKERPLTHLLQFFGRTPTASDTGHFRDCATEAGYETHPKHGEHYDSAILLAAIPSRAGAQFHECGVHTDSVDDYVSEIVRSVRPSKGARKRLVLSGAFADCEPDYYQNMTNAVHAFAQACIFRDVRLIFGAHPTFQFLLFDTARRMRPGDFRDFLRMYVSRHFATDAALADYAKSAEVIATHDVGRSRADSLTAMRRAMLLDKDAGGLVVIGGKTARGGHTPGVDEEIALARSAELPVYMIGSVGGRSGEVLSGMPMDERIKLNSLPEDSQTELLTSLDYGHLAMIVLDSCFS